LFCVCLGFLSLGTPAFRADISAATLEERFDGNPFVT
jgi:hypothetical protein